MFGLSRKRSTESLEREYDRRLHEAVRAAMRGRHAEAARHSAAALAVSRRLYHGRPDPTRPDPARHRPALAAALYNHAGNLRRVARRPEALNLLAEAGEHYDGLAETDPTAFRVPAIDVLVRTGLTVQDTGDRSAAAQRFREAIRAYPDAPTDDPIERDLGLARAHFHLGRCLLEQGHPVEGLAELDTGLFAAERVRQRQGIPVVPDYSWLASAPRSFQLTAPDWLAAAVCAMELHDAAGRFDIAADAANIAVRVSGGLAVIGGRSHVILHRAVLTRAQTIWRHAQNPVLAALGRIGPGQEVTVGGARILFTTPDIDAVLRATGWLSG